MGYHCVRCAYSNTPRVVVRAIRAKFAGQTTRMKISQIQTPAKYSFFITKSKTIPGKTGKGHGKLIDSIMNTIHFEQIR